MLLATQLRAGMAIRYEGQPYKVLAADYHPGQGRMGGSCHARLRNLDTGTLWEHSFRSEMKLEEIPLSKQPSSFCMPTVRTVPSCIPRLTSRWRFRQL